MKIGILGGSFDPVHLGHLWIAEAAIETLALDQLWMMPAAQNPLKADAPSASDEQRLTMLRLAVGGHEGIRVDDRELRRGETSYTVDTLREIREERPDDELFLIVGGDSVASFDRWREPEQILRLADLACVRRGGEGEIDYAVLRPFVDDVQWERIQSNELAMPVIELSSRDIRGRIAAGRSVRYQIPAAVQQYIVAEGIYA